MVHKPERWAVNQAGVDPEWQWAWRDLKFLAPLWEGSGQPASILPDAQISDVSGTPTWQISSGGYARRYDTTTERDIWSGVASDILNQVSELTVLVVCDPSALTAFRVAAAKGPALASNTYWLMYHDDVGNISGRTHIMGFSVIGSTSTAVTRAEGSTNSGNGRVYVGRFRKDPLRIELWVDGLFDQANTTTSASSMDGSYTTATPITVGNADNNSYPFDAPIEFVGVWERYLSDAEIRMLSADPFGPIRPRRLTPADVTNRPVGFVLLDATNQRITTTDHADFDVPTNGIIDVRVDVAIDDYESTGSPGPMALAQKWNGTTTGDSWIFSWSPLNQQMKFDWRNDAQAGNNFLSSALTGVFTDFRRYQMRVLFDTAGGTDSGQFFYRSDGDLTSDTGWTSAGTSSPAATTIQDTATDVTLAWDGGSDDFLGRYYRAQIEIDGSVVASPDFTDTNIPHVDGQGKSWSLTNAPTYFGPSKSDSFRTKVFVP